MDTIQGKEVFHANYESGEGNVDERWPVYKMAEHYVDIVDQAVQFLDIKGDAVAVDLATGPAELPQKLALTPGNSNLSIFGFDIHPEQYRNSQYWKIASAAGTSAMQEVFVTEPPNILAPPAIFMASDAISGLTQFDNDSVDIVSMLFAAYHFTTEKRIHLYDEIRRVLQPNGKALFTTSGRANKVVHRHIESQIASDLAISAPPIMNASWTTEIAKDELPKYFDHVYCYEYTDTLVIDSIEKYMAYVKSLVSMKNQFTPEPTQSTFLRTLRRFTKSLYEGASSTNPRIESIARSAFVTSSEPLEEQYGFKQIT